MVDAITHLWKLFLGAGNAITWTYNYLFIFVFILFFEHTRTHRERRYISHISSVFPNVQNITITIHMFKLLSYSHKLFPYNIARHTYYRVQQFNLVILNCLKWIMFKLYNILQVRIHPGSCQSLSPFTSLLFLKSR